MRLALSLSLVSAVAASMFACAFDPNGGGANGAGGAYVPPGMTGTGNSIVKDPTKCVKEPGSDVCMEVCNTQTHEPMMLPPDLLLVLDKSGSMLQSVNNDEVCDLPDCENKWLQVTKAINNVVAATDNTVNWGLKYFSDSRAGTAGGGNCAVGNMVAVQIAKNTSDAITQSIGMATPMGYTPTRAAISTAVRYLQGLTEPNPKYIVLATDGQPNCPMTGRSDAPDDGPAVKAVADAFAAGFPTFVIGISLATATLNDMAKAGGVPKAGAESYYPVTSTADLETALKSITGQIATCNYPLAAPSATNDPNAITIHVNGKTIPQDPANGWDYTSPAHTGIKFFGSACDTVMKDPKAKVEIFYACMGQPPVP